MRGAKTSAWTMKSLPGTALITCEPVQPGCKQLIWSAHKPRFKSTLARLHLPKLWFLDIVQWPCAPRYLFFEDAALCQCKEALPWTQVTIKLYRLQQMFIFYLCPPSVTFATMLHCCGRANQRRNIPEGTAMWCSADCGWNEPTRKNTQPTKCSRPTSKEKNVKGYQRKERGTGTLCFSVADQPKASQLASWYFEPCQPLRTVSGLKTNLNNMYQIQDGLN